MSREYIENLDRELLESFAMEAGLTEDEAERAVEDYESFILDQHN